MQNFISGLCGWCCGCCLAIQIATRMGETCMFPLCCPGWLLAIRAKLRGEQNIQVVLLDYCCKYQDGSYLLVIGRGEGGGWQGAVGSRNLEDLEKCC